MNSVMAGNCKSMAKLIKSNFRIVWNENEHEQKMMCIAVTVRAVLALNRWTIEMQSFTCSYAACIHPHTHTHTYAVDLYMKYLNDHSVST